MRSGSDAKIARTSRQSLHWPLPSRWKNQEPAHERGDTPVDILLILIPITLILVTVGVVVFNWAVKSGQYDDLEGPAHRILYDDDRDMIPDDAKQPHQKDEPVREIKGDNEKPGDERNQGG